MAFGYEEELKAEIARLRLTDAERDAIEWASRTLCVGWQDLDSGDKRRTRDAATTLRDLLERITTPAASVAGRGGAGCSPAPPAKS